MRTTLLFHITNQDQRATKFSFTTGAAEDWGLGLRICVDRVVPLVVLDVITPLETSWFCRCDWSSSCRMLLAIFPCPVGFWTIL